MSKVAELYERAALCRQKSVNCSREAEKKGWFQLASIWLILADSLSARFEFRPAEEVLELTAEEMLSLTALRPIASIGRANGPRLPNASRSLVRALPSA